MQPGILCLEMTVLTGRKYRPSPTRDLEHLPGSDPGLEFMSPARRYTGGLWGGKAFANPKHGTMDFYRQLKDSLNE